MATKKLIEVALPLEKINAESAREKSIRVGHPSTLHLWWARRPLAAARAIIWSSLVDDPSSHPEKFPTEELQSTERKRLFRILEDLVVWENIQDESVLLAAKQEILKSTNGNPPAILDPFAGGGAIPLEGLRLGLEAHAHDLNPVAIMINKSMIEIPSIFANKFPVNPDANNKLGKTGWKNAAGLANDVRYYGAWVRNKAFEIIGHMYPEVCIPKEYGGGKNTVIAWLWARTAPCSNPACGKRIPLTSSYVLSSRPGKEYWAEPIINQNELSFVVHKGKCPKEKETDKVGRAAVFRCPCCGEITTDEYIKRMGKGKKLGSKLMAVVSENKNGRVYLSPSVDHELAALVDQPENCPSGSIPQNPRWFSPPAFGMEEYADVFTNRQLVALSTFCELIQEAQKQAEADAIAAGFSNDHIPISKGGSGAKAYGEAVGVYLAFAVDKAANIWSSLVGWMGDRGALRETFSRQAMPMVWDYAEANPFSDAGGNFLMFVSRIADTIDFLPSGESSSEAMQHIAQDDCGMRNIMVSTDPPYYDNIGYADLSDYFYIWMRQSLQRTYPELFSTMLVPKVEELIATPFRHNGSVQKAKEFFEDGMLSTCKQIYKYVSDDIPVTIYYAYKRSETDEKDKTSSSGWETMLTSIVQAGFSITGTWPVRTESPGRAVAQGTNALASSIVLVCRKRPEDAPQTTRRNLVNILRKELRPALKKLQDSNIAPVDLAQSAIGPGMGVFSRYRKVLDADGTPMTVRSALQVINEEIDLYFNEQVGELDAASRFCVDLFTQYAYNDIKYGEAEVLANAKGTSIPMMASHGVLYAKAGIVHLVERKELPEKVDHSESNIWMLTQQLTQAMAKGGVEACAQIIAPMFGSNAEKAKDLAYRLYTIAEQKKWAEEAYAYNALVVAWPDIQTRAASLKAETPEQLSMF